MCKNVLRCSGKVEARSRCDGGGGSPSGNPRTASTISSLKNSYLLSFSFQSHEPVDTDLRRNITHLWSKGRRYKANISF